METPEVLNQHLPQKDFLLHILHAIQKNNPENNITPEDIKKVAKYLNTTTGFVYGVVRYYSMFSIKPRGKYIIRFCKSPLCRMVGAFDLLQSLEKELSVKLGETTRDKMFTLEPSECLGHCDKAPVMMINEKMYVHLDEAKLKQIIEYLRLNGNKT
jgi:NADH:ubiquinone oxidoreductase subunit E